jgi:hypothetical protein
MRLRILLALSTMTDDEVLDLAANIGKLTATSTLATANPPVSSGATSVVAKATTFKTSRVKASNLALQTIDAETSAREDREGLVTEIHAFASTVLNVAATADDLTSVALTPRDKVVTPTTGPETPTAFVITKPKYKKGYAEISVTEPAGVHGRYYAEWTQDPIGTWARLAGTGKSRRVTGASGTKVWVRFARVRGAVESAWSEPQLIVIP